MSPLIPTISNSGLKGSQPKTGLKGSPNIFVKNKLV